MLAGLKGGSPFCLGTVKASEQTFAVDLRQGRSESEMPWQPWPVLSPCGWRGRSPGSCRRQSWLLPLLDISISHFFLGIFSCPRTQTLLILLLTLPCWLRCCTLCWLPALQTFGLIWRGTRKGKRKPWFLLAWCKFLHSLLTTQAARYSCYLFLKYWDKVVIFTVWTWLRILKSSVGHT